MPVSDPERDASDSAALLLEAALLGEIVGVVQGSDHGRVLDQGVQRFRCEGDFAREELQRHVEDVGELS